jgi:type 1 glutamine amidotransferase
MVWGGWGGHEPQQCVDKVAGVLRGEGFDIEIHDNMEIYKDKEKMAAADIVIPCWTMGNIEKEQAAGLLECVKAGTGLAGWHGGMCDSFRQNVEYQWMTGGQWVAHPGGVVDYEVIVTNHHDPITRGVGDFKMRSEQYYMHTDPGNDTLAHTIFHSDLAPWINGTIMPVVWKRMWGAGRVFYSSLGHIATDFDVPEVMEIFKRGVHWAVR